MGAFIIFIQVLLKQRLSLTLIMSPRMKYEPERLAGQAKQEFHEREGERERERKKARSRFFFFPPPISRLQLIYMRCLYLGLTFSELVVF